MSGFGIVSMFHLDPVGEARIHAPEKRRHGKLYLATFFILSSLYISVVSEGYTNIVTRASHDDFLFMKLGASLASGKWLGAYDSVTFIKGIGFPAFLAVGHFTGLPVDIFQAVFRVLACLLLLLALRKVLSDWIALLIALVVLWCPIMFWGGFARILRESFYISGTIILAAAACVFAVLWAQRGTTRSLVASAVLLGVSAGVLHLTREEGIWLAPPLMVLWIGMWLLARPFEDRSKQGAILFLPVALVALMVAAVGSINYAVYGRFIVNEVKNSEFQGAMAALQRASYRHWQPYLPVPKAARQEIYAVSPAFAKLRPSIDPPGGQVPMDFGCRLGLYPHTCGDIAGGWFMWLVRAAAENAGMHRSPTIAAEYYATLASEVNAACDSGALTCAPWMPPLIPPMTRDQIWTIPGHFWAIWASVSQRYPVISEIDVSSIDPALGPAVMNFLNHPRIRSLGTAQTLTFSGWYRRAEAGWFRLAEPDASGKTEVERRGSLDLVTAFGDPRADRQRFTITVPCHPGRPCGLRVVTDDGLSGELVEGPSAQIRSLFLGEGVFHIDTVRPFPPPPRTLRTVLRERVVGSLETIRPFYTILADSGPLVFLFLLVRAVRRREITTGLVVAAVLGTALATRVALLTLVEASSFPASNYSYTGVAVHLAALFALVSWAVALGFERRETRPHPA